MSITIKMNQDNTGIQMSGTTAGRNKTQDTKTRSTVFAGDLMLGQGNQIEQKKQTARRQAMKLITDAWGRDELASQSIKDMEQQKADYVEQMQEAKEHEKTFEKSKKELQEQYGVADDSQEQKDLELLEKFQNYKNGSHDESFTKELQNLPRTEYQEKALRLNQIAGSMKVTASNANDKLIELTDTIAKAKTDQAKSQDMLKAGSAADDILEASNKEIMGLLIQDGKEHIDKEQEEAQKKAEEQKEKRDEQQERIDEAKQERKEQEELIKGQAEADSAEQDLSLQRKTTNNVEAAQQNIRNILEDNNLLAEDLKGIKIDFNF